MKNCSVPDCDKTARWRGMCGGHYTRWRRHGDAMHGGTLGMRASNGSPLRHVLEHMYDECPKWPFSTSPRGYGQIVHNGKKRLVHNLVCELVHGPAPTAKHHAAHNCGKGHEGCFGARCVEWKTPAENRADTFRHGTHIQGEEHANAKLTEAQVNEIRRRAFAGENQQRLAEEFGIVQSAVSNIKFGRRWARAA